MQELKLSPNVAHSSTVQNMTAALELGTGAIMEVLGGDEVASTLNGEVFREKDVRAALTARISKKLGV